MIRFVVGAAAALFLLATPAGAASAARADAALDRALQKLVAMREGPPGVIALVQRGADLVVHTAGVADVADGRPPVATDHMRIASVTKAFSGAVALSLVQQGRLGLDDTIGQRRPDLPAQWHGVTLRQLLNHTSGVPDFISTQAAQDAIRKSLDVAPPPRRLLDFVQDAPLKNQGRYHYSNSDNIIVGLIAEAVTEGSYQTALADLVAAPLGLVATSLPVGPAMPAPFLHGYDLEDGTYDDASELLAAGWAWASGGIVSTPADLNRFIRGYVGGALFGPAVQAEQRRFVRGGGSEPRGPGRNAAGLALFRYATRCGTVYGHTGNTFGYTQFAAASADGNRSATMAITLQRTQESEGRGRKVFRALRRAELLAVCAALAR
ncbi:MAG: beta-lactamase family protein [bacterium]|nr:beta-lactamase family protein [bacterium]